MDYETLKSLDYLKIIETLENHCITDGGKELAKNLLPFVSLEEAILNLKETTEEKHFLEREGDLPFLEFVDAEPLFEKVKVLSLLNGEELLKVASILGIIGEIREIGEAYKDNYPLMHVYTSRLANFKEIVNKIHRAIEPDGNVADDASPLLAIIRREIKITYMRIQTILQEIIYSKNYEDVVQDQIITKRNGRYVIPIRQNSRPGFQYVVQGESGSRLTLFVEPISVVELNNKLVDLSSKEKQEEERIILELEGEISGRIHDVIESLKAIYKLDFIFAKAKLSFKLKGEEPQLVEEKKVVLFAARHPLISRDRVIPIDVEVGEGYHMLIITGPNTGGKTVTLKTVGLLTLMAESGLHIPAYSNSEIGFFNKVFADIGDEQSIQQNLSTFSSHMARIVKILNEAETETLVLIDELGAGTDPEEGSALGYAILNKLYNTKCVSVISTHHSRLKEFPYEFSKAKNASVGFDTDTLEPTYKVLLGIPGESHAFVIAERLGLPQVVLENAKRELSEEHKIAHEIINKMAEDTRQIGESKDIIEKEKKEIEDLKDLYEKKLAELEERKRRELKKAYEEAQQIVDETREKMAAILGSLDNYIKSQKAIQEFKKSISEEEEKVEKVGEEIEITDKTTVPIETLHEGSIVFVKSFKRQGILLSILPEKNKVVVQMGVIRATISLDDIEFVAEETEKETKSTTDIKDVMSEQVPLKIDLHGLTVEEALEKLDKYLDSAYLAGMSFVYIEHGKGTGALREAVFEFLRKRPHISHFQTAMPSEGGIGVTIVYFK